MHLGMMECLVPFYKVTVTLTSDLVFRKVVCGALSYIIKGKNPRFGVWMQLLMAECHVPFLGHFDLWPCL